MPDGRVTANMKLKINEVIIPGLASVYQSFNPSNGYKADVTATFKDSSSDISDIVKSVEDIEFTSISVLNENEQNIATIEVDTIQSIDRNIVEGNSSVQIRFC